MRGEGYVSTWEVCCWWGSFALVVICAVPTYLKLRYQDLASQGKARKARKVEPETIESQLRKKRSGALEIDLDHPESFERGLRVIRGGRP